MGVERELKAVNGETEERVMSAYWSKSSSRWLVRVGVSLILGWVLAGIVLVQSGAAGEET